MRINLMKPTLDERMPGIARRFLFWTLVVPFALVLIAGLFLLKVKVWAWALCAVAEICR